MKKGHHRDSAKSATPDILSIDATLALSRKVIKQSLDLNLPRSRSICTKDSKESEDVRRELEATREELISVKMKCQQAETVAENRARKLGEIDELAKYLRLQLKKKNEEVSQLAGLLEQKELKEKEHSRSVFALNQERNAAYMKSAVENKALEETNAGLKATVSRLERQVSDQTARLEQTLSQVSALSAKLQVSEATVSRLTAEINQVNTSLAVAKQQLQSAEDAKSKLHQQLQDVSTAQSRVLVESTQLPRLDAQLRGMEATHLQQVTLNLRLQEDVRRLERENEDLKRSRIEDLRAARSEVSQQTAKFSAQIGSLESQLQRYIECDQENRGRLGDSKSSVSLRTHKSRR